MDTAVLLLHRIKGSLHAVVVGEVGGDALHLPIGILGLELVHPDMVAALPESMIAPLIAQIPLGRIGEPEDIANAFV